MFGTAGLLHSKFKDTYPQALYTEYQFLKHKYNLQELKKEHWLFFKTQPRNFPTIRLAQLAQLLNQSNSLFHFIESKPTLTQIQNYFNVSISDYWNCHFIFEEFSKQVEKKIGKSTINLLIINVFTPFIYFTTNTYDNEALREYALELLYKLPPEINHKTKLFTSVNFKTTSALESQAVIELHDHYCKTKQCLQCTFGQEIIKIV